MFKNNFGRKIFGYIMELDELYKKVLRGELCIYCGSLGYDLIKLQGVTMFTCKNSKCKARTGSMDTVMKPNGILADGDLSMERLYAEYCYNRLLGSGISMIEVTSLLRKYQGFKEPGYKLRNILELVPLRALVLDMSMLYLEYIGSTHNSFYYWRVGSKAAYKVYELPDGRYVVKYKVATKKGKYYSVVKKCELIKK